MFEPRTSRSGVQGVNRYATRASMHIPDRGKPYQRLKRLNSILFLWAYNVSAIIVKMLGEKGEYYNPESQESELSGV